MTPITYLPTYLRGDDVEQVVGRVGLVGAGEASLVKEVDGLVCSALVNNLARLQQQQVVEHLQAA